jgi:Protein of unknown function (DUF3592).
MAGPGTGERPALSRLVYLDRAGFAGGIVAIVIGLAIGSVGTWHLYKAVMLDRYGVATSGRIHDRRISESHSRGRTSLRYYLDVMFQDQTGRYYSDNFPVSHSYYTQTLGHSGVEVRYLPHRPTTAEVEPGRARWLGNLFGIPGLALLLGGLYALRGALRQIASRRRALERGEARQASVTAIKPSGRRDAGIARLHWTDITGASGITAPRGQARMPLVGSEITIFVDPVEGNGYWEGEY